MDLVRAEEVAFAAMAAPLDQPHDDGSAHHNEGDDGDHPKKHGITEVHGHALKYPVHLAVT